MSKSATKKAVERASGLADEISFADSMRRASYTRQQFIDELDDAKYNEALLNNEEERTKTALYMVKLAKTTAKERGLTPQSSEYNSFIDTEAARSFKEITDRAAKVVPAKRVAFRQMINEGVLDSFLDPEEIEQVQNAVAKRQLINRSPTKAFIDFAKQVPDERLLDVLVKGIAAPKKLAQGARPTLADKYARLTNDEANALGKLQTEPWLPDVAQEQGIVGLGTRILTTEARGAVGAAVRGKQALVNAPVPQSSLLERAGKTALLTPVAPALAMTAMAAEAGKQLGEHAPGFVEGAKQGLRTIGVPLEEADMALREKLLPPGKLGQIISGLADYGLHRAPQMLEAGLTAFAPTSPEQTTFGAPAQEMVQKLRDPGTLVDVTAAAGKGAIEGIRGPGNLFSLAREAQTGKEEMALRAAKQARETMPGAASEVLDAQAKLLYTQMRNNEATSFATESPATAQAALEFAVPSAAVSAGMKVGGKVIGAGLRAARRTETGAKALDWAGDLVRWNNAANKLVAEAKAKGTPAVIAQAVQEADLQRLALDRGTARATEIVAQLDPDVRLIRGLVKTPVQKSLVWQALHGKVPLEQVPPDLLPAVEAGKRLNDNMYKAGIEDGWLHRWEGDELANAPQRADYGAPHMIKKDPGATIESSVFTWKETPQAGMAKERTAPMEVFAEDPVAQYEAAIKEIQKKSATAATLNEMKTFLGGKAQSVADAAQEAKLAKGTPPAAPPTRVQGIVTHVTEQAAPAAKVAQDIPGFTRSGGWLIEMPRVAPEVTETFRNKLMAETNMEWVSISPENADLFALATGTPGVTKKGGQTFLMPRPWAQAVNEQLPLLGVGKKDGWAAVGEFTKKVIAPWNQMSRAAATSLGGGLQWLGLNVATAQTFPMVAHGLKALDPSMTKPALLGALQLASFGDDAAKATQVMLRSGRQVSLGDLLNVLNKYGFTSQFDASIMGGAKAAGGLRGLASGISKTASATLPLPIPIPLGLAPGKVGEFGRQFSTRNLAQLADNYQRLVTVIGFLDDITPAAVSSAISKAGQYVGNYNRLSPFERDFLSNTMFFYGWAKISLGSFFAGLRNNPKMLADFAKARLQAERSSAQYIPPTGIPSWAVGMLYPTQRGAGRTMIMGAPQTPDIIAMGYLTSAENVVRALLPGAIDGPTGDKDLGDNAVPAIRNAIELLLNVDARWGGPSFSAAPVSPEAYGSTGQMLNTWRRTAIGKIATAPIARPLDQTIALIDFLMENKQYTAALQVAAAYRAKRMAGLSNPLQPEYVADVPKNMALSERRALERGATLTKELIR